MAVSGRSGFAWVIALGLGGFEGVVAASNAPPKAVCGWQLASGKKEPHLTWTAYKFTEKVGVPGTFSEIKVESSPLAPSPQALFTSVRFQIEPASIDTGMPERDKKLAMYVFGAMERPRVLRGRVLSFNESSRQASLELEMNERRQIIPFAVERNGANGYVFTGSMDLNRFHMQRSLQQITEVCADLHKGAKGKAKTWSTVDLRVDAEISHSCTVVAATPSGT